MHVSKQTSKSASYLEERTVSARVINAGSMPTMRYALSAYETEVAYDHETVYSCSSASCSSKIQILRQSGSLNADDVCKSTTCSIEVTFTSLLVHLKERLHTDVERTLHSQHVLCSNGCESNM